MQQLSGNKLYSFDLLPFVTPLFLKEKKFLVSKLAFTDNLPYHRDHSGYFSQTLIWVYISCVMGYSYS